MQLSWLPDRQNCRCGHRQHLPLVQPALQNETLSFSGCQKEIARTAARDVAALLPMYEAGKMMLMLGMSARRNNLPT